MNINRFAAFSRKAFLSGKNNKRVMIMGLHGSNIPLRESGLDPGSIAYIEEMHKEWRKDPLSVHSSWRAYFKILESAPDSNIYVPEGIYLGKNNMECVLKMDSLHGSKAMDYMRLLLLARVYQTRGHLIADLDPLGIIKPDMQKLPDADLSLYGFTEGDLDRQFDLGMGVLQEFPKFGIERLTLREIINHYKNIYCSKTGIEYSHIDGYECIDWIKTKFEVPVMEIFTNEEKITILDRLIKSDTFERFMSVKFPTEKRFGLEGVESLIPLMQAVVDKSIDLGVESIVIGMPHRGRLNVLSNVLKKANQPILAELSHSSPDSVEGSGDVKHHLGMNFSYKEGDREISLSLVANPSHLESVNPVVLGKTRAIQFYQNDPSGSRAISLLIHGDASFSAQGVVYESMGISRLPFYTVGGTIHIVANNQIGFTTDPRFARSSPYCSDIAKAVSSPILHVNGDDVYAVVRAAQFAAEWRAKWKRDIVLDIICYRRHGHNEIDQPMFTQPLMYKKISKMVTVLDKFIAQLVDEKVITLEEANEKKKKAWEEMEADLVKSSSYVPTSREWLSSCWPGRLSPSELAEIVLLPGITGVKEEILLAILERISNIPKNFNVHSLLKRVLSARENCVKKNTGVDMATAEALCFGSLLSENIHVRLSGQDVERGTFSQRHAVIHDQETESTYVPLSNIAREDSDLIKEQAVFTVSNSSLSEYGIMGYELGYSLVSPHSLVLWEAQFGDFANTAQCIIDQYVASGEQKWLQRSAFVILLPHGYDGQGPEHSSGHLERFLQLVDESPYTFPSTTSTDVPSVYRQRQVCNIQVVYPTVPSNYFHVLRRQVNGEIRKPLILFESKALLRHPLAKSDIKEMSEGTFFQKVIPEVLHEDSLKGLSNLDVEINGKSEHWAVTNNEPRLPYNLADAIPDFSLLPKDEIRTLIFCSGQVYYTLFQARAYNNLRDIAIVRLEQLAPFPFLEVREIINFYSKSLKDIVWCQEEPLNHGAWNFVQPRVGLCIDESNWRNTENAENARLRIKESKANRGLSLSVGNEKKKSASESIRGVEYVRYAGRDPSASPATGSSSYHQLEVYGLVSEALMDGKILEPKEIKKGIPIFT